jgi:uncharacterized protein
MNSETTPGPRTDEEIPRYLAALGLPGLADVHVHFLPGSMQQKVWAYFDRAKENYGWDWPVNYRFDEGTRLEILRGFGLKAIPALAYPHKPGMAQWLNEWSARFAEREPDVLRCATFYPEPGVGGYVAAAVEQGARLFKVHIEVGGFAPDDPLLDPAWEVIAAARVPVVIHAGSAPLPGEFTGTKALGRLLARHPGLVLVIAHLGMPEYEGFADLAEANPDVYLDTTMIGTDFTNKFAPMPAAYLRRLPALAGRVVLGSDFPNIPYPYAHQLQALARLELGDDWMRQVLWTNGARLLGLAPGTGPMHR